MKEDDLLLCTVERITPTNVFVKLPDGKQGTIILSEIAPGRIKNIRQYVVPNKKIVCKVLRIRGDNIDLTLRRVSSKEKKQVMDQFKQEQSIKAGFKQILKDKAKAIEEKIKKDFTLTEFLEQAHLDPDILKKYIPKKFQEVVQKIIQKKQKQVEIKKIIKLKCLGDNGINKIKKIMAPQNKDEKITYISAGKFQISLKADDYKQGNKKMKSIVDKIEKLGKKYNCEFEVENK